MPRSRVVYFVEDDGTVPIVDWLGALPRKASTKCHAYLFRLQEEGHELRRPVADFLRDGIHELRPSYQGVQYRILYFFHGREAVVVSHGVAKEGMVPANEIDRAIRRMRCFESDAQRHSFEPGLKGGA